MKSQLNSERGATSIEAALVVPFLLSVILLLTQFIFLVFAKRTAQSAAEHGAEEAAYYEGSNSDGRLAALDAASKIPGLKNTSVAINRTGADVVVIVTGTPIRILPINMAVEARSSAPIEQIVASGQRQ